MDDKKVKRKYNKKKIAKHCTWLIKGHIEPCGKPCYKNNLCGRHQFWDDKRTTVPKPWKGCGKAVLVDYQLCVSCGALKMNYKLKCIK